ncbi:MAG TPA: thiamine-phosphate kinase [Chromatiales bacterium]|nr:thiamine-phosphate kinase [Chromatiales bacterium]
MGEFDLIRRHLTGLGAARADVAVGVGDDAAVVRPPPGRELVLTTDLLLEGVHFLPGTDPEALGWKALAVSLSDLAAMGAEPAWATLALSLPRADEAWLAAFARGLDACARAHGVAVVGGDTVRGPLAAGAQLCGLVPEGAALRRAGARPGDVLCVTGTLGDAAAGLALARGGLAGLAPEHEAFLRARLERPAPRVAAGVAARGMARAAIDVSDGLLADLAHLLEADGLGARVEVAALPCSAALAAAPPARRLAWQLGGGDDYELLLAVAPSRLAALEEALRATGTPLTAIGRVEAEPGIRCVDAHGRPVEPPAAGWDHFARDGDGA